MRYIIIYLSILLFAFSYNRVQTYDFDLQGHRGARGLLPENTIPGFLIAIDHGVDTIEIDLVVTRDQKILISHEPWFHHHISTKPDGSPVTEEEAQNFNIYEMTYAETQEFDVGIRVHQNFPEQKPIQAAKPLMKDAIAAIDTYVEELGRKPVRYNIEMKSRPEWYGSMVPPPADFAQLLYDELSKFDILDRINIQSFDPAPLIEMRKIDPDVKQAILVSNDEPMEYHLERLGYTPEIWSPNYQLVNPEIVRTAHEKGMKVVPWTVNETEEMRKLLEMGIDGIITDYPDRAAPLHNQVTFSE